MYGEVIRAYVIYKPGTQISKCFGYVQFNDEESAKKACCNENFYGSDSNWGVRKFNPNHKKKNNGKNSHKNTKINGQQIVKFYQNMYNLMQNKYELYSDNQNVENNQTPTYQQQNFEYLILKSFAPANVNIKTSPSVKCAINLHIIITMISKRGIMLLYTDITKM